MKKLKIESQKPTTYYLLLIAFGLLLTACNDKRTPQVQYMPDMYESVPYNADSEDGLNNNAPSSNLKPVAGTIARGKQAAYNLPDTYDGYELARETVKSPLAVTEENLENGKAMYNIYCATCHGKKGDGKGVLPQREKFLGIPNYKDRELTEGNIYHVVVYGKNFMGSHASQLTQKERWQVVQYVEKLRNDLIK